MIKKNYRKTVGIFGGTGFIGEEIVQHLVKNGFKIKIATRNVYLAQTLKVYGDIAQIELHQVNLKSEESIKFFLQDCDVCINLVGILFEKKLQKNRRYIWWYRFYWRRNSPAFSKKRF